jgi:hypothetical protein
MSKNPLSMILVYFPPILGRSPVLSDAGGLPGHAGRNSRILESFPPIVDKHSKIILENYLTSLESVL